MYSADPKYERWNRTNEGFAMLKEIIIKEFREQILTAKMMTAAGIILLAMIGNGLIFSIQYTHHLEKYHTEMNASMTELNEKTSSLFNLLFHQQKLIKTPSKLAFISEAEQRMLPNGIRINYFTESQPEYYKGQNRFFERFEPIDWTFILITIISFIAIAFSYNAFSGEKVKGTLRLMLSNSISRSSLIFGKLLSIVACIAIPFIMGMALNLLILQFNPNINLTGSDIGFILIFLLLALVFIAFNVLLGLFISSLTSRPVHSLNLVLIVWIFFCIIIPSVSWIYARRIIDVPSDAVITQQASQQAREANEKGGYSWSWRSSWEGQPPNETVRSRAEGIQVLTRVEQEVLRNFLQDKFRQTRLAISLSKISPFSVFRFLSERISDNGYYGYERFYDQVRTYHNTFNDFAFQKDQQDPDSHHLIWNESWASKTFTSKKSVAVEEIPRFEYRSPSPKEVLQNGLTDILILILWNVVLFASTFVAFIRYDVR